MSVRRDDRHQPDDHRDHDQRGRRGPTRAARASARARRTSRATANATGSVIGAPAELRDDEGDEREVDAAEEGVEPHAEARPPWRPIAARRTGSRDHDTRHERGDEAGQERGPDPVRADHSRRRERRDEGADRDPDAGDDGDPSTVRATRRLDDERGHGRADERPRSAGFDAGCAPTADGSGGRERHSGVHGFEPLTCYSWVARTASADNRLPSSSTIHPEPIGGRRVCPIGQRVGSRGAGPASATVPPWARSRSWRRIGDPPSAPAADRAAPTATHGFGVALNPATIGTLLAGSDGATRERLIATLQRIHGNAAVQRLLAGPRPAVQRWAVTLPRGTTDCNVVVNWMNTQQPVPDHERLGEDQRALLVGRGSGLQRVRGRDHRDRRQPDRDQDRERRHADVGPDRSRRWPPPGRR